MSDDPVVENAVELTTLDPKKDDETKTALTEDTDSGTARVMTSDEATESQRKETAKLRPAVVGALLLHVLIIVIMFVMAYTDPDTVDDPDIRNCLDDEDPTKDNCEMVLDIYFSYVIMICAFGALNALIIAAVEAWSIFQRTAADKDLPTWKWHSDNFQSMLGQMFVLTLFFWPAMITYILHQKGDEFANMYANLNSNDQNLVVMHIIVGLVLFVVDVVALYRTSQMINVDATVQKLEAGEEDVDALAAMETDNTEEILDDDDDDEDGGLGNIGVADDEADEEDDEAIEATGKDRVFSYVLLLCHWVLIVDIWTYVTLTSGNSGVTTGAVVLTGLWLYMIWKGRKVLQTGKVTELFLHDTRLIVIGHFFLAFSFWWLTVSVFLFQNEFEQSFFDAVTSLENSGGQALVFTMGVAFVGCLCIYIYMLWIHKKSIWANNRIHMMRLFEEFSLSLTKSK
jgi:hypothetical protein